jgi:hypothetical protein
VAESGVARSNAGTWRLSVKAALMVATEATVDAVEAAAVCVDEVSAAAVAVPTGVHATTRSQFLNREVGAVIPLQ